MSSSYTYRKSTWESIHQALTPRGNSKNITTTTTTITRAIFLHVGCCLSQTALAHWWFKTSYLVWARFPFDPTLFDFSFLFVFNFSTLLCVHCILDECTQQFAFAHLCDLPVTCSCALVCLFCLSTSCAHIVCAVIYARNSCVWSLLRAGTSVADVFLRAQCFAIAPISWEQRSGLCLKLAPWQFSLPCFAGRCSSNFFP